MGTDCLMAAEAEADATDQRQLQALSNVLENALNRTHGILE